MTSMNYAYGQSVTITFGWLLVRIMMAESRTLTPVTQTLANE